MNKMKYLRFNVLILIVFCVCKMSSSLECGPLCILKIVNDFDLLKEDEDIYHYLPKTTMHNMFEMKMALEYLGFDVDVIKLNQSNLNRLNQYSVIHLQEMNHFVLFKSRTDSTIQLWEPVEQKTMDEPILEFFTKYNPHALLVEKNNNPVQIYQKPLEFIIEQNEADHLLLRQKSIFNVTAINKMNKTLKLFEAVTSDEFSGFEQGKFKPGTQIIIEPYSEYHFQIYITSLKSGPISSSFCLRFDSGLWSDFQIDSFIENDIILEPNLLQLINNRITIFAYTSEVIDLKNVKLSLFDNNSGIILNENDYSITKMDNVNQHSLQLYMIKVNLERYEINQNEFDLLLLFDNDKYLKKIACFKNSWYQLLSATKVIVPE